MSRKLPPNAFAYYLELGVGRNYEAVGKQFGCSKRTVTNHATKDRWQERLAEAERARTKKAEEKAIETLDAMDERQLKVLRYIQGKAIETLKATPMDSAMDAVRAYTLAIEKERLIRGEPTERTAMDIEKKIREEHEKWLVPVEEPEPAPVPESVPPPAADAAPAPEVVPQSEAVAEPEAPSDAGPEVQAPGEAA